ALIASDAALEMLEGYANDTTVIAELLRAWDAFDRETYARNVLSHLLRNRVDLRLERLPSLDGIQYFTNLTSLNLSGCSQVSDLSPLASLTQLTSLDLSSCSRLSDLSLTGLKQLILLNLSHCSHLSTLSLMDLTQLTSLDLSHFSRLSTLSLTGLKQLAS